MSLLRDLVRKAMPAFVLDKLWESRRAREHQLAAGLKQDWENRRMAVPQLADAPTLAAYRVVIIPSDQGTLFGSCGEDAMITAAADQVLSVNPQAEITVLVSSPEAESLGQARGYKTASIWTQSNFLEAVAQFFIETRPNAVLVVGADVVDGHYGEIWSAKLLIAADTASRMGIPVTILGFSFNRGPSALVTSIFDQLHPNVVLNVRDEISAERLHRLTSARGRLVADSAFLLRPKGADSIATTKSWAQNRRELGRRVVGFNIHPMLFKRTSRSQVDAIVRKSIDVLCELTIKRRVAWLLLPHDFRAKIGDAVCLKPIMQGLSPVVGEDAYLYSGEHSAAILKGMAGIPDGIVTGRMHLAIAGLGQEVPAACITYQDKFEGLFQHFRIPREFLLSPSSLLEGDNLQEMLLRFVDELPSLKQRITDHLPAVVEMSKKNFDVLYGNLDVARPTEVRPKSIPGQLGNRSIADN